MLEAKSLVNGWTSEEQCGFFPGCVALEQLYTLNSVLEEVWKCLCEGPSLCVFGIMLKHWVVSPPLVPNITNTTNYDQWDKIMSDRTLTQLEKALLIKALMFFIKKYLSPDIYIYFFYKIDNLFILKLMLLTHYFRKWLLDFKTYCFNTQCTTNTQTGVLYCPSQVGKKKKTKKHTHKPLFVLYVTYTHSYQINLLPPTHPSVSVCSQTVARNPARCLLTYTQRLHRLIEL